MKNNKTKIIGVIGLGYVGLPLAVEFAKKYKVFGYDININRVRELNNRIDNTLEVESKNLNQVLNDKLTITSKIDDIKNCNIYIITVPTPVDENKNPDLKFIKKASSDIASINLGFEDGSIGTIPDLEVPGSRRYCYWDQCSSCQLRLF